MPRHTMPVREMEADLMGLLSAWWSDWREVDRLARARALGRAVGLLVSAEDDEDDGGGGLMYHNNSLAGL